MSAGWTAVWSSFAGRALIELGLRRGRSASIMVADNGECDLTVLDLDPVVLHPLAAAGATRKPPFGIAGLIGTESRNHKSCRVGVRPSSLFAVPIIRLKALGSQGLASR